MYHAGVDGGLLDVSGDAGDKSIPVLKVGVEIGLLDKTTVEKSKQKRSFSLNRVQFVCEES